MSWRDNFHGENHNGVNNGAVTSKWRDRREIELEENSIYAENFGNNRSSVGYPWREYSQLHWGHASTKWAIYRIKWAWKESVVWSIPSVAISLPSK